MNSYLKVVFKIMDLPKCWIICRSTKNYIFFTIYHLLAIHTLNKTNNIWMLKVISTFLHSKQALYINNILYKTIHSFVQDI